MSHLLEPLNVHRADVRKPLALEVSFNDVTDQLVIPPGLLIGLRPRHVRFVNELAQAWRLPLRAAISCAETLKPFVGLGLFSLRLCARLSQRSAMSGFVDVAPEVIPTVTTSLSHCHVGCSFRLQPLGAAK
ncbi:MAG TPA: hypothetical protein VE821_09105 [Pyrinomonadaceae bacterium]|nr:hypothetical protein [Pyrinomonadaceae bacterium]